MRAARSRSRSWPRGSRGSRCASRRAPARWVTSPPCSTRRRSKSAAPSRSAWATSSSGPMTSRWRWPWPSRLLARGLTFGVAESLTGGLIASRLVNVRGCVGLVPRGRRRLRLAGQVRRPRGARRPGGHRGGGGGHGRGCGAGDRSGRGPRHHRRGWARRPGGRRTRDDLRRASPSRGGRPRRANCACPGTVSACASTGPFQPSTCSDARSRPTRPEHPAFTGGPQRGHT